MAKFVFKDAYLVVNGVNLSDHVKQVEIDPSAEDVESTAMSDTGKRRLQGLRDESIDVTFLQDFAAANVDATLWPLYSAGTSFTVEVRPTSGAVSATNPKFTATCLLLEYQPIGGSVGDIAEAPAKFTVDGVITRATS